MENSGDFDKYTSAILPLCQPTASQEEYLKTCPFARESEFLSDEIQSSSSSEQATGILMLSLPESSDIYQTPPEHYSSQNSSNNDQVPATKTKAICRDMKSGKAGDGNAMTEEDDDEEQPGQQMVDLANDSDNPGLEDTIHEIYSENLVCETKDTEIISSLNETADQVFEEMPKRATIVNTELNTGKRKLPSSSNTEEQNRSQNGGDGFKTLLDRVLKILKHEKAENDENEDDDFLEVAKKRGLTFPDPRW